MIDPDGLTPELRGRLERLARHGNMPMDELCLKALELGIHHLEATLPETLLPTNGLSKKQRMVLHHLKLGKSVKEIAFDLRMGESSVRTHITRLKEKLGCGDLLELRMLPRVIPDATPEPPEPDAGDSGLDAPPCDPASPCRID